MTVPQKLKTIRQLSGLTQEKLARVLGVSFATLNSWINAKSVPRKKAREQIESLYREYTGKKIVPEKELTAKRNLLETKNRENPGILKTILANPDIYQQFLLVFVYSL